MDRVGAYRALLRYPTRLLELRYGGPWPGEPRPWLGGPQPFRVSPLCCRWAAPSWPQRSPPPCHLHHPSDQQLVSATLALTSGRAGGQAGVSKLHEALWGNEYGTGGNEEARQEEVTRQPQGVCWDKAEVNSNTEDQLSLPLPGARPERDKSAGWILRIRSVC